MQCLCTFWTWSPGAGAVLVQQEQGLLPVLVMLRRLPAAACTSLVGLFVAVGRLLSIRRFMCWTHHNSSGQTWRTKRRLPVVARLESEAVVRHGVAEVTSRWKQPLTVETMVTTEHNFGRQRLQVKAWPPPPQLVQLAQLAKSALVPLALVRESAHRRPWLQLLPQQPLMLLELAPWPPWAAVLMGHKTLAMSALK